MVVVISSIAKVRFLLEDGGLSPRGCPRTIVSLYAFSPSASTDFILCSRINFVALPCVVIAEMKKAGGSDSKYFNNAKKGETMELREELRNPQRDRKRDAVKKVIANMTVGKDVSTLFPDVINCIQTDNLELKKLVYLYLINYAKSQPDLALLAVNTFVKDANDPVRCLPSRIFSPFTAITRAFAREILVCLTLAAFSCTFSVRPPLLARSEPLDSCASHSYNGLHPRREDHRVFVRAAQPLP